jgi:L-lactate dehydrogenase complex protein LldG
MLAGNRLPRRHSGTGEEALGKTGDDGARAAADAHLAAHAQGPRPAMPADLVTRFLQRATDMSSTVERIASRAEIPAAVARYLDALDLPPALAVQKSHAGVCWPEFADLDWSGAGLTIEARPTSGHDRLGITGSFCAIAETGTLVFTTSPRHRPPRLCCPIRTSRWFARTASCRGWRRRLRWSERNGGLPRAINMISGPSRTGDIEQTIVLGAHGPFRVHILPSRRTTRTAARRP